MPGKSYKSLSRPVSADLSECCCIRMIAAPPGTVSAMVEATECVAGTLGRAQASSGQTGCTDCEAGSFTATSGQSSCKDCSGSNH